MSNLFGGRTVLLSILMACATFSLGGTVAAADSTELHKSIVQINTFSEDINFLLKPHGSGSGVIIDASGLVLTNSHVVKDKDPFDQSNIPLGYQVCLTVSTTVKPDCLYTGELVAANEDLDVALIRLRPMQGVALTTLQALPLAQASPAVGASLTALGYPAIGGNTITIAGGTVTGTLDKYGQKWLKTDAEFSYGSSGGAAISNTGELVGIPTQVHADLLGSFGYVLDIGSVRSWVTQNMTSASQASPLNARVVVITSMEKAADSTATFSSSVLPRYTITRPSHWQTVVSGERGVSMDNESDDEGGFVKISVATVPFRYGKAEIEGTLERLLLDIGALGIATVTVAPTTLGQSAAFRVTTLILGEAIEETHVTTERFHLVMSYDYGVDQKDKAVVDGILNSFTLADDNLVPLSQETYTSSDPLFSVRASKGWVVEKLNDRQAMAHIYHRGNPRVSADIGAQARTDREQSLSNEQILQELVDLVQQSKATLSTLGLSLEVVSKNAQYALHDSAPKAVYLESVMKKEGAVIVRFSKIIVPKDKREIIYALTVTDPSESVYATAKSEFLASAKTFRLSATPGALGTSSASTSATPSSVLDGKLLARLKGHILLQVESKGEAWYVDGVSGKKYYLRDGTAAYGALRKFGLGVKNADLEKIPVGVDARFQDVDSDGDGLSDQLEDALKTDSEKADTDGDGYKDGAEVAGGYNPLGSGRARTDTVVANILKGRVVLQVESRGEAWYVNPKDGKRYYMKDGDAAYAIMRYLGLGVTNSDAGKIESGTL